MYEKNGTYLQLEMFKYFRIPCTYFPKHVIRTEKIQVHGFCDASEVAYLGVVYIRMAVQEENIHVSLVVAKSGTDQVAVSPTTGNVWHCDLGQASSSIM